MTKQCFVISPIGREGTDTRKRADVIIRYLIRPPLEELGYEVRRGDQIPEAGIITNQVINLVANSDIVIADLTGRNPNVYYELAIRHCMSLACIMLIDEKEDIPFNLATSRVIRVDHTDLESVDRGKKEIQRQVKNQESDPASFTSPVSVAMNLEAMRRSGDPASEALAEVRELVANMKHDIDSARSKLLLSGSLVSIKQTESIVDIVRQALKEEEDEKVGLDERMRRLKRTQAALRAGDGFLQDGRLLEAEAMYDQALARDPKEIYALIGKAKALKRRSAVERNNQLMLKAVRTLDRLIVIDPTYERAYYNRACYKCLVREQETEAFDAEDICRDLQSAIDGFGHYRKMAQNDEDFRSFREEECFRKIVGLASETDD